MKLLNKTEQIARLNGGKSSVAVQEMLTGYCSTPHPATGVPPYEALMNRQIRTKLDHQAGSAMRISVTKPSISGMRNTRIRSNRMPRTGTPKSTIS